MHQKLQSMRCFCKAIKTALHAQCVFRKYCQQPSETNQHSSRKCLAIICALVHLRVNFLNCRFRLCTDNWAIAWLVLILPKKLARIFNLIATIIKYSIVIEYVRKVKNSLLTRFPGLIKFQSTIKFQISWRAAFALLHVSLLKLIIPRLELTGSLSTILMKRWRLWSICYNEKLAQAQSISRIFHTSSCILMFCHS